MTAIDALRPAGPGQSYVERRPRPGLARLVASVWVQRVGSGAAPYRQLNIPTGGVELTCRLGDAPSVRGPSTVPVTDTLPPGTTVVGVRLQPGAAAATLGLPADALRDTVVDLEALWGDLGLVVADRIHDLSSPAAVLTVLQDELQVRTPRTDAPDPLVAAAVGQLREDVPVTVVSARLDISDRQLRRRCEAAAGLAPKTLHRILRFQRFVARTQQDLAGGTPRVRPTIATLAAELGYADEAHLSRECVRLTGRTPAAFLADAREQCACGHDHAASYAPQLAVAGTPVSLHSGVRAGDDQPDAVAVTGPPAARSSPAAAAGSRPWGR